MRADPPLPRLFTRTQVLALGFTVRQIEHRLATGVWRRVRREVYCLATADVERARIEVAWWRFRNRGAVVSHASAARWWKLPDPRERDEDIWLTRPAGTVRHRDGLRVQVATLTSDVVPHGGVRVTSPARTVVDCARHLPERDALAIADEALRTELCTRWDLGRVLGEQKGWRGIGRARSVVALADGRRESPLESWSAWTFHELGIPAPEWQQHILTPDRRFVARVDALWPGGLIGEADGRGKYGTSEGDKQRAFDDEKRREGLLRQLGGEVLRWYPEDVLDPELFPALKARFLALAGRPRPWAGVVRR